MRESINYNMIPLPCDNMINIVNVGSTNFLTNVSSNAYYGYQPQLHVHKEAFRNESHDMKDTNTTMEVQYSYFEENCFANKREFDVTQHVNRKRRCCYDQEMAFKKRRQNDQNESDSEFKKFDARRQKDKDGMEMEENMLREIHGVNMYHWVQNGD